MKTYIKLGLFIFFFSLAYVFSPSKIYAENFLIDSTFGTNGKVITSFGYDSIANRVLILPGGKKLVVGNVLNAGNRDSAIAKYNANGSLDTSFGVNGKVLHDFGGNDSFEGGVLQSDGKYVFSGYSQPTGNYQWTITRLNSDGTVDVNFGNNGVVINFPGIHSLAKNIILQADGKILAVGWRQSGGQDDVVVARYNSNGSLDAGFGSGGIVITPIGGFNDRGMISTVQSDGKIIVFGDFDAGGRDRLFLARYNTNGTLDSGFGSGGKVIAEFQDHNGARDIALQSDGKIIVTGATMPNGSSANTYVGRFNSNGTFDNTFASGGKYINSFSSENDSSNSLLLQPDGKIILGGNQTESGNSEFALRRFNLNGSLDTSFGNNGSLVTPVGSGNDEIRSISMQDDGKILAAGLVSNGSYNDWGIVRYQFISHAQYADFKQTDPQWGSTRLNNDNNCGDLHGFGCAVTSVADVFYSYGGTTLPDNNEQLDPGTLNNWLSENSGFQGCSIYWSMASTSIKIGAPELLTRKGKANWPNGIQNIDEALSNGDLPILGINTFINGREGTHFLVVSERLSDVDGKPDYKLVDPALYPFVSNDSGNTGKSLSESYGGFDNVFQAVIYKKGTSPQKTFSIGAHSPIQLLITDPDGNIAGYDVATDEIIENIPDSAYGIEPGIAPIDGHADPSSGKKYFQQINPAEGEYTVQVIGTGNGAYTLGFARTDEQANVGKQLVHGFARDGVTEIYKIQYIADANAPIVIEKVITFETLKADLEKFYSDGSIDNKGAYKSLLKKVELAERMSNMRLESVGKRVAGSLLRSFLQELEAHRGRHVEENAYQMLKDDANYILKHL